MDELICEDCGSILRTTEEMEEAYEYHRRVQDYGWDSFIYEVQDSCPCKLQRA